MLDKPTGSGKVRLTLLIVAVIVVLLIFFGPLIYLIFRPPGPVPDIDVIRDTIARHFPIPEKSLLLNLPPSEGRLPGAIVQIETGAVLNQNDALKKHSFGKIVDVTIEDSVKVDGNSKLVAGFFQGNAGYEGEVVVKIKIEKLQVVDCNPPLTLQEYKQLVEDSQNAMDVLNLEYKLFLITKSYRGNISITIEGKRKADAKAEVATDKFKVSSDSGISGSGIFKLTSDGPIVFAYQGSWIGQTPTSAGSASEIDLEEVLNNELPNPWDRAKTMENK